MKLILNTLRLIESNVALTLRGLVIFAQPQHSPMLSNLTEQPLKLIEVP